MIRCIRLRIAIIIPIRKQGHPIMALALILAALLACPTIASPQAPDRNAEQWRATFLQLLGVQPDTKPLKGTIDLMYNAVVVDARRFAAVGIAGVKNGDRLRLTHLGDGFWRIKHLATGLDFEIDLNPTRTDPEKN